MDKEPPPVVESSEMTATVAQQTPDIQYINGNVEAEYEDSQGPPTKKPRLEQQDTVRDDPISLDAVVGVQLVMLNISIRNKPLLEVNTMLIRYEKCRHLMDMYAAMFLRLGRCFPLGEPPQSAISITISTTDPFWNAWGTMDESNVLHTDADIQGYWEVCPPLSDMKTYKDIPRIKFDFCQDGYLDPSATHYQPQSDSVFYSTLRTKRDVFSKPLNLPDEFFEDSIEPLHQSIDSNQEIGWKLFMDRRKFDQDKAQLETDQAVYLKNAKKLLVDKEKYREQLYAEHGEEREELECLRFNHRQLRLKVEGIEAQAETYQNQITRSYHDEEKLKTQVTALTNDVHGLNKRLHECQTENQQLKATAKLSEEEQVMLLEWRKKQHEKRQLELKAKILARQKAKNEKEDVANVQESAGSTLRRKERWLRLL